MRALLALTGRLGTVLIVIALALLVTSSLPTRTNSDSGYRYAQSDVFVIFGTGAFPSDTLSPQQTLHLTLDVLNVTSGLDFFLINSDPTFFNNWIFVHNQDPSPYSGYTSKTLSAFMQAYPQSVIASRLGVKNLDYTFLPANITNALPIASNPTGSTVVLQFTANVVEGFIPQEKTSIAIEILSASGLGLIALWAVVYWKEKTRFEQF